MKVAEPASEILTKVTTSLRKGDLGEAARLLASLDRDHTPTATELTLVSRLSRMTAAALRGPLDDPRLIELIGVVIQLSTTAEVTGDLSKALAQGLRTVVSSYVAQEEPDPGTFDRLASALRVLCSKMINGELSDAVLSVAEHIPDTPELTHLLSEMAEQWRRVGFDTLSSERIEGLTRIASKHLHAVDPSSAADWSG
ncbi:hypothetical protein [Mesorhizobium sp. M2A.F.Ca.ET.039.01.1.1]|uniref:hypothetical protein n=1 Tax=Mesorhizobium sp. M2A.F.Ca.ET.039.01.1.1 TaxID=2496746 RepID=UPI000FC9E448|nr:hypothetical protein [Mesorhizobium sp. M2A.F.Ca.ET.039.01.1.1]RWX62868.1 hypothetical protein EOA24_26765 [Mesorhizobium sp. M2A.F.Ca.ET.039.01.1.1]